MDMLANTQPDEPQKWYQRGWNWLFNKIEDPDKAKRQTYAFLPAALEVQETPPSPIGRVIIWTIVVLFAAAVLWACIGKVDIVAVAQGKIIPSGRVKTIQPLETGIVAAIHIKEGQRVNKGDALITLDSTHTEADTTRLGSQLIDAKVQQLRQQLLQELLERPTIPNNWYSLYGPRLLTEASTFAEGDAESSTNLTAKLNHQQRLLVEQVNEYRSRQQILQNQLAEREAESQRVAASVNKLERTLPIVTERTQSLETLLQKQLVARAQYLELEQDRIVQEQDLAAFKAEYREILSGIGAIQSQLTALKAESQKNNLSELTQTEQAVTELQQELIKAEQRNSQQVLHAPIAGTVQQLSVHTVGGVVTSAQELMLVVPEESSLEVEAFLLNKDIGFVTEGQIAEVKIDTFNFTKYGLIDGEVINISDDAIQDENLGLVYLTKVLLTKTNIQVNERLVNLSPGMGVTVEVKTGQRRLIEFFLSPLLKSKQESIRER